MRQQEKQILVGAHRFKNPLRGDPEIIYLAPPTGRSGDLNSTDILQHRDVARHIGSAVKAIQDHDLHRETNDGKKNKG